MAQERRSLAWAYTRFGLGLSLTAGALNLNPQCGIASPTPQAPF